MGKHDAAAKSDPTEEVAAKPYRETITYVPGNGDPVVTLWGGHTFRANEPKELVAHAEGTARERLNHEIIELARDNKHFTVGSGASTRSRRKAAVMVETPEQYRAHLADWMKEVGADGQPVVKSASQLVERFAKERDMRTMAEVGASDYDLIGALFMPKLHDLAKADELTADQVTALWRQHGFNELPW
jgi:hypothetical protein